MKYADKHRYDLLYYGAQAEILWREKSRKVLFSISRKYCKKKQKVV